MRLQVRSRHGAVCALLLAIIAVSTTTASAVARDALPTTPYTDVGDGHLFATEIGWMSDEGIALGFADGTFRPAQQVTRGAMGAFLYRFDGTPPTPSEPFFADVDEAHLFYEPIGWMAESGLSLGVPQPQGKPLYLPNHAVTRGAMAAFLHRYQIDPVVTLTEPFFADVDETHLFYEAIQWMAESGLSLGVPQPEGKPLYLPNHAVTRGAMSAFLYRYEHELDPRLRCNGARQLCDRAYNEVSYATTHNAMSSEEDGWAGRNQWYAMPRQLDDGIRGLMLDTHYNSTATHPTLAAPDAPDGVPLLCHGYCKYGWMLLTEGLGDVKAFLDENPNEIVTIIFESYVTASDTRDAFIETGLIDLVVEHTAGTPWPTLREMIAAGTRVVVLTDSGGGTYPWYLRVWDEAFETHWSAKTPEDLNCNRNRGSEGNSLFILNHFLTDPVARITLADQVNYNPFFIERALQCQQERNHVANFPTVDFYDRGDIFDVVDELNGL